jgi:hypothetical protein
LKVPGSYLKRLYVKVDKYMNHSSKKIKKSIVKNEKMSYVITLKNNKRIVRNLTEAEKRSFLNDSFVIKCEKIF